LVWEGELGWEGEWGGERGEEERGERREERGEKSLGSVVVRFGSVRIERGTIGQVGEFRNGWGMRVWLL